MTVAGGPYQARIAEEEPIVHIRVLGRAEVWLTDRDEDDNSDLSWLQDNYYSDRKDAIDDEVKRERHSKVGLCAKDFLELVYPVLNEDFREWWEDTREQIEFPDPDEGHLVFVTNLLDFPWGLLPLENGRALNSVYSVSSNPSQEFLDSFSGNDAMLMSWGALGRRDSDPGTFEIILGSNLKREVAVLGGQKSLWRRSRTYGTPEEEELLCDGIMGIELQCETDISARVFGDADTTHLPSIWFHEGHGHEFGLELGDEDRKILGAQVIAEHLENTQGSIDFCWLSSCHGIQMAHNAGWMKAGKVMTLLGHLGMGDESGDVIAFEMLVLERLMMGYSVGRAVQLAKKAMEPEMGASGSFTLLGDPRLVLVD